MTKWSLVSIVSSVLFIAPSLRAQLPTIADVDRGNEPKAAGPLPNWDVASVKPHSADDHMMSWQMTPDGLKLVNLALEQMLCSAWDMKPYQIAGLNGWMTNTKFDLTAKVSGEDVEAYKKLSSVQRREMLQRLLTERFQMKTHTDTRSLPVYDLVVDKSGSKLKPTTAIEAPSDDERKSNPDKYRKGNMMMGPGMFEGTGVRVGSLASQLGSALGKPVQDLTGLTGVYDVTLHFRPEEAPAGTSEEAPSVFSAVQDQLGLRLVANKGPVEILIVDAAQKPEAD